MQSRKERSVERSLRTARQRAESRSERFIAAATQLLMETGNLDFTVSELVERSGLSLRSFYQHFAGKDELLLAVFEEAIRSFVATLRAAVAAESDPQAQLKAYILGFYGAGEEATNRRASAALSRYMLMLTSSDSDSGELARVLAPQVDLLAEILSGPGFRRDIPPSALTVLVTQTLMSAVEMNLLGTQLTGLPIRADDVWAFCLAAVKA